MNTWRSPGPQGRGSRPLLNTLGGLDRPTGREALVRWIRRVDERPKLRAAVRAPLVKGSHEQLMLNPLFRRLRDLNREIRTTAASRCGAMGPRAHGSLGLAAARRGGDRPEDGPKT